MNNMLNQKCSHNFHKKNIIKTKHVVSCRILTQKKKKELLTDMLLDFSFKNETRKKKTEKEIQIL